MRKGCSDPFFNGCGKTGNWLVHGFPKVDSHGRTKSEGQRMNTKRYSKRFIPVLILRVLPYIRCHKSSKYPRLKGAFQLRYRCGINEIKEWSNANYCQDQKGKRNDKWDVYAVYMLLQRQPWWRRYSITITKMSLTAMNSLACTWCILQHYDNSMLPPLRTRMRSNI